MSNPAAKTHRISKNHFRLIGKDHLYFKGSHIASFKPLPKNKLIKTRSIIPTFNHDQKHYTSAFHLPTSPNQNDATMLDDHQRRATEALQQLSQLWMPKPRSRHKYCGVCRGHYEDYKEHIQSELHFLHLKNSRYQEIILRTTLQFQSSHQKKQDEPNIIDLTTEEVVIKSVPELMETTSSTKGIAT